MKKSLLTVALLATTLLVSAQNAPLMHIDQNGLFYVGKDALVYNGGGLQTKGTGATGGILENHGNVMVSGVSGDVYRNLDGSGNPITTGGNVINKLNEPTDYDKVNPSVAFDPANPGTTTPKYTYGQLFITGLNQADITGVVNQEYRQSTHGSYQQLAFPFYDKTISQINSGNEFGKTFGTSRGSKNEMLFYNNTAVVSANMPNGLSTRFGVDLPPYSYFMVGGQNLNVSSTTRTIVGRPVSDKQNSNMVFTLAGAGAGINFGTGGFAVNQYNERYNSYLSDAFQMAYVANSAWIGDFGRNIYQFGNPFLTNLDLSQIAYNDVNGDGNLISNIYGVRLEPQGMVYTNANGSVAAASKQVTFGSGVPTGDVEYLMIRPMGTFVIKLKDNASQTLDFKTLRRFNYYYRTNTTGYDVTASKTGNTGSTVKQLGVFGLDANGNELERTYYVVSPNTISGQPGNTTCEVGALGGSMFSTFEEDPINGGYDYNNVNYSLYVNEANEVNFKGKNIKLVNYNPNIVKFKFEIRENANLVSNGTHLLSAGEGFYYKRDTDTNVTAAAQNGIVSVPAGNSTGIEYDFYYGLPSNLGGGGGTLGTTENTTKDARTLVIYNPDTTGYFVRFDPSWKKATVEVFDMSGKLVISAKNVDASKDYTLDLDSKLKTSYVVKVVSDKGIKVTSKIVK